MTCTRCGQAIDPRLRPDPCSGCYWAGKLRDAAHAAQLAGCPADVDPELYALEIAGALAQADEIDPLLRNPEP